MPDAAPSEPARFTRPLLLAKLPPLPQTHFVPRGVLTPTPPAAPTTPGPETAVQARAQLAAELPEARTPAALIGTAAAVLAATLKFEFSAAYVVPDDRPDFLVQIAAVGLPGEFAEVARLLPVQDFADIADQPVSAAHPPAYGDFFAPVAAQFGLRAWLVASLADPMTLAVRGALLLGSADAGRLPSPEANRVLTLAASVAAVLAERFPRA